MTYHTTCRECGVELIAIRADGEDGICRSCFENMRDIRCRICGCQIDPEEDGICHPCWSGDGRIVNYPVYIYWTIVNTLTHILRRHDGTEGDCLFCRRAVG